MDGERTPGIHKSRHTGHGTRRVNERRGLSDDTSDRENDTG